MPENRCPWAGTDPLYIQYHDEEWGVPCWDDRRLFEMLILEGAQAGLSWITILKRREGYRRAFNDFDPKEISQYGEAERARLLTDEGIIRNRAKIASAVSNAQAFLRVQREFGTFADYLWNWVGRRPVVGGFTELQQVPASTSLSDQISKNLKARGFSFVGSTIIYAYLQAVGVVNDHLVDCPRFEDVQRG